MNYLVLTTVLLALLGGLIGVYLIVEIDGRRIAPSAVRRERACPRPPRDLRHQEWLARVNLTQFIRPKATS